MSGTFRQWRSAVLAAALCFPLSGRGAEGTIAKVQDPALAGELDEWRAANGRFSARMRELEADTRSYIDEREKSETERLSQGYDAVLKELDESERSQRALAVDRFERFLGRYPHASYSSHVRFRLAELYWEDAKASWLKEAKAYYELEDKLVAEDRVAELPAEPKMDLGKVEALYLQIVTDNQRLSRDAQYEYLDGVYYSLAFVYKEENALQFDAAKGKEAFETLLRVRPDSALADDAHLDIGNYLFEKNQLDAVIKEYWTVYA